MTRRLDIELFELAAMLIGFTALGFIVGVAV